MAKKKKSFKFKPDYRILGILVACIVLLGGFYLSQIDKKSSRGFNFATSPSPTPTATPSTKSYNNDTVGFSLNYPLDWKVKSVGSQFAFTSPDGDGTPEDTYAGVFVIKEFGGEAMDKIKTTALGELFKEQNIQTGAKNFTKDEVGKVGDLEAYFLDFETVIGTDKVFVSALYVVKDGYIYNAYGVTELDKKDDYKEEVDGILKSFRVK